MRDYLLVSIMAVLLMTGVAGAGTFFDGFEDGTIDPAVWTTDNSGFVVQRSYNGKTPAGSDYLVRPATANGQWNGISHVFTEKTQYISCDMNAGNTAPAAVIVGDGTTSFYVGVHGFYTWPDQNVYYRINDNSYDSDLPLKLNAWAPIEFVMSQNAITAYYDGQIVFIKTFSELGYTPKSFKSVSLYQTGSTEVSLTSFDNVQAKITFTEDFEGALIDSDQWTTVNGGFAVSTSHNGQSPSEGNYLAHPVSANGQWNGIEHNFDGHTPIAISCQMNAGNTAPTTISVSDATTAYFIGTNGYHTWPNTNVYYRIGATSYDSGIPLQLNTWVPVKFIMDEFGITGYYGDQVVFNQTFQGLGYTHTPTGFTGVSLFQTGSTEVSLTSFDMLEASQAQVAHWTFNEGANATGSLGVAPTMPQWIINDVHTSVNGTVTATESSPSYIRVDGTDLGIKFAPGSGDFVQCPDDDMLDLHEDQSFTIEMQVRVDADNNDQDSSNWILCKGFPQTDTHGWGVMYNDQTKKIVVNIAGHAFESALPLLEGWWYHIAIRHIANTGEYDLYINHEKEATLTGYYNGSVTTYPLYIGQGYGWMAPRDFVGAINELRITQTAINPVHFLSWPAPCTSLINKIPTITSLQNALESQGKLDVYGKMRQTLINKFMTYLAGDYTGQPELAAYGMRDLESIVDSEITRLTMIADNQALPVDSPRRVTNQKPIPTSGHLSQQVVWADNTTEDDRPVFLFGFHGAGTLSDWNFDLLSSLGCNLSSVELGLHNSMPEQPMWNANDPAASTMDYGFLSYWKTFASDANSYGILTDFMIGPHYIQEWFIKDNKQYYVDMGGFLNYAINQPEVHTLVNWTTRLMVDTIKDAPGYWSSCLINEPEFGKWIGDPDTSDMWLAYLQDKYVTVSILNSTWGTSYGDFNQIPAYWTVPTMPFPEDPKLYDWMKFNDQRISSWVSDLNDSVNAADSSILTHAKQCDRFLAQSHLLLGSDIDQMCRFTNGLAGHDLATWPKPITGSDLAIEAVWVMMFDSILHQVSGKPIYNSENHLLRDSATNDILPGHVRAAVWLSALSGLDASTAWSWNREPDNPDSLFIGLWQYRPGATEEYMRTGMDLMRVMPNIVALRQTQAKVAVLYSRTSVLRDPNYAHILGNTYQILLESGVNVQAITEQMIENGEVNSKLPDLSLLIIPGATYLSDEVYSGLVSLSQAGVNLVGVGNLVGGKNAYTLPRSTPFTESGVSFTKLVFGDLSTLRWQLIAMLETVGGPQYDLIDMETGSAATGVIYRTVQLSANEYCATAVNLNRSPVTVRFEKAGSIKTFSDQINLLPNGATQEITLQPLEVIYGSVAP